MLGVGCHVSVSPTGYNAKQPEHVEWKWVFYKLYTINPDSEIYISD